MYSYPQYIYPPTTAPVQQYFANPHVRVNEYGLGDFIDTTAGKMKDRISDMFGVNDPNSQVGKALGGLGKLGLGNSAISGIAGGIGKGIYSGLSGGLNSGFGKAFSGVGTAVGGFVGNFNPILGAGITLGSNLIGGIANWGWGTKRNDAAINAFNADTDMLNNTRVADSDFESIADQAAAQNWGSSMKYSEMGKTGVFNKGAFEDEYDQMNRRRLSAMNSAAENYNNATLNVTKTRTDNMLKNWSAYGGYFDNPFAHPGSGAIAYGLEQQNLANQQQLLGQMQAQQTYPGSVFAFGGGLPFCFGGKMYADGGGLSQHGSDFTNGIIRIDAGGTHEQNPFQGVQIGTDSKGVPNMVEEGEIIHNNYVFSNRLTIPDDVAEKLHTQKGKTFAEGGRIFEKESKERPNDPISLSTLEWGTSVLREAQELVKQRKKQAEQEAAAEAFTKELEQMPPEEQAALLQQIQSPQQMQMPQMPQDAAAVQQPMMPQDAFACGGKLHGYGGYLGIPMNMFAGGGHTTIRYADGVNRDSAWNTVFGTAMVDELIRKLEDSSISDDEFISTYNAIQDAYHEAFNKNTYDFSGTVNESDVVGAHQTLFNDWGLNSLLDREGLDLSKVYNGSKGMTSDNLKGSHKPDRTPGAISDTRFLGSKSMDKKLRDRLDAALKKRGMESYVDSDAGDLLKVRKQGDAQKASSSSSLISGKGKTLAERLAEQLGTRGTGDQGNELTQKLLPTWMRYAPVAASGIASLTDMLGLTNKPDYTGADTLEAIAERNRGYMPVSYNPIGQYMRPVLFDPYQAMIANNANTSAIYRGVQDNSNGNAAMGNAAMIVADRNLGLASGALSEAGQKYNADMYKAMLDFNRNTDAHNSQGSMSAQAENAHNWRLGQGAHASLMAQALGLRQKEQAAAAAARSANLSNFVKSLAGIGRENFTFNQIMTDPWLRYSVRTNGENEYKGSGDSGTGSTQQTTAMPSMATNPFVLGIGTPSFMQQMPSWEDYMVQRKLGLNT